MKTVFCFVVLSGANFNCWADNIDDYPLTKSCFVQYLHETGKLADPLPLTVHSPPRCRLVVPYIANITIEKINDDFTSPKSTDCVKNEFVASEYFDYVLKSYNDLEAYRKTPQETVNLKKHVVIFEIDKCKSNGTGVMKDPTVEEHQLKYCMRKYTLDNQLSEYVYVNPYNIDTEVVNCTNIVAVERSKTETQFKEKLFASECDMNEFRNGHLFDLKVEMFYTSTDRIDTLLEKFLSMPASGCTI